MTTLRRSIALLLPALLSACATLQPVTEGQKLRGQPQSAVQQTFGQPTDTFQFRDGTSRWLYSRQPAGRYVYAADFSQQGSLTDFRQVLSTSELYKAKVGTWTKRDVLEHFGQAKEPVQFYPLMQREVWSYRFWHEDQWPSMFNFYFDTAGVLQQTQITPDPLYNGRTRH